METYKHAYLIIAHNEFGILKVLLSMLDDERNDIYLHLDKKAGKVNLEEFKTIQSRLIILNNRIDVRWGHFSLIRVELLLFEEAYKVGGYAYYHLLSGVDLPIKTQDYIHHFFDMNNSCEFVGFSSTLPDKRVLNYHLFMGLTRSNRILNAIIRELNNCSLNIQNLLHIRRKKNILFRKGCNWVSITPVLVRLLLEKKEYILKRFRYTCCGDEWFIQSVLWNSELKERIYNQQDEFLGCMRCIDWKRGHPYVWRNEDFNILKQSEALFARKFSSKDVDIVFKMQEECLKK